MASYFVAMQALVDGAHAVHERNCCPPGAFPHDDAEYLGDFLDARQALAVARVRYVHVAPCACCAHLHLPVLRESHALSSLRS